MHLKGHADSADWARPLPRGRHGLSRTAVRASQRERLLRATAEIVSERGYAATTVPQIVAAAHTSPNVFYGLFADKTECFIALCEEAGNQLATELAGFAVKPDWLSALDHALHHYLRWWQQQPALTWAYFVELPAAGPRALEERDRQRERFTAILRQLAARARSEQPGLPRLSELALATAHIAPTELIAMEVRAGRLEGLPDLHDELRSLLVKLLADDATARASGH